MTFITEVITDPSGSNWGNEPSYITGHISPPINNAAIKPISFGNPELELLGIVEISQQNLSFWSQLPSVGLKCPSHFSEELTGLRAKCGLVSFLIALILYCELVSPCPIAPFECSAKSHQFSGYEFVMWRALVASAWIFCDDVQKVVRLPSFAFLLKPIQEFHC